MNPEQFYALPQSPQTFKQLLMVGGMDKYFQIVKCFRDEDLRADRQPEFTQIDCEMSFVTQEDVLNTFEGLTAHLLKEVHGVDAGKFPVMSYDEAMERYGNDKPDIRFGMELTNLNEVAQHKDFQVFNGAEYVVGIAVPGANTYTRKEIDALIDWVKRPQIGAKGLVYVRCNEDGTFKSSVDKFYDAEDLATWAQKTGAQSGDLILVLSGDLSSTRAQMSALRMYMAEKLGLRKSDEFAPLWVVDFPLLEKDEETGRYHAMHHPFTSPKPEQIELLDTDPGAVKANAYDLVLNGNEIGGGSIRIHDKATQQLMFKHLGFTPEEAKEQFGFLMDAFEYGAPPHGGIAFGLDRLVAILGGAETIRDFIAFPKNNSGRDVMIDAPAHTTQEQLDELHLSLKKS
jgi:aspartyl-tRNA synthetase